MNTDCSRVSRAVVMFALALLFVATAMPGSALRAQTAEAAPASRPSSGGTSAASAVVSPEPFFKHADYGSLHLSPSGKYLGALVPVNGRVNLAVLDVAGRSLQVIARAEGQDIASFTWVNDNRLVFSLVDFQSGLGEQRGGGLYAVNRDGTDVRELAPSVAKMIASGQYVGRYTALSSVLRDGSDDVLVVSNEFSDRYPDVFRVNTMTGKRTLKSFDKPGDVIAWVADRKGAIRAAVTDEKADSSRVYWRSGEDAKWVELGRYGLRGPRMVPVTFDGDGTLIVAANFDRDTLALYRYDTEKRALGELMAAHPRADLVEGLVYDEQKQRIVGLEYEGDRPGTVWFDEEWARLQKSVDAALPNHRNQLSRGTAQWALVYSYSDTDPGGYYLLDLVTRKLQPLAVTRKAIKPDSMPARQAVHYPARDGLDIPAYLMLPKDKDPHKLPLVLYVHGGPWVPGAHWAWNPEAAYLASLGYAVLEPEFRGTVGRGRKLYEASFKQWGRAMQDDLNDGMDWLAKQGTIDPARVCIMGASYGGYAVMEGLARDPERFVCGINYVGVTDINLMFDVTWSDMFDSTFINYMAKEMIGDPDRDAAQLRETSPLQQAARIKAPVLMAYGGGDRRVPVVHGERMRDALQKQGTPVEWVLYGEEGHGFMLESTRYDFYGRVARFLAKNLGPR